MSSSPTERRFRWADRKEVQVMGIRAAGLIRVAGTTVTNLDDLVPAGERVWLAAPGGPAPVIPFSPRPQP
jgi:hypothetical protein